MKQSIVRIATIIWIIGLTLSVFLLSVPPHDLPIYIGLACISLIPLILGAHRYRIFGIIALIVSLLMVVLECLAGVRIKEQKEHNQNSITTDQQKP
jgi:cell division protein FtsW (lipid II flippase)